MFYLNGDFFPKNEKKISNMPPFDFLHFLLKSACSLPEFVGSLMWPPTPHEMGQKVKKQKKVYILIPP